LAGPATKAKDHCYSSTTGCILKYRRITISRLDEKHPVGYATLFLSPLPQSGIGVTGNLSVLTAAEFFFQRELIFCDTVLILLL
jgi:hypothetical protein